MVPFSKAALKDLRDRLHRTRWPEATREVAWTSGVDRTFLMDICEYWRDYFDWENQTRRLSALHHYRYRSGAGTIHFLYERGRGLKPIPLILTHGWPGSYLEMLKILPHLTDPESQGHDPADSFDVVVPSLPGFGYSSKPE